MVGINNSSTSSLWPFIPRIWRFTSTYPRYGMAASPIPSSSNNWPRAWICKVRSSHNWALMLETWAPKSIKAATYCPSIITGASLECPIRCAIGSGLRNSMGATCCHPFLFAAFIWVSFGSGSGRECCKFTGCMLQGIWLHSLGSPHPYLTALLELHTSLAIWPQPWHLKHCRVLGSFVFWALPYAPVNAWVLPLPCEAVVTLPAIEELWAKVFWPRPVWPLWELGQTGVFLSILPLPWPLCLGLFGVLAGQVSCSALFRAAINQAIWLPSSFEPSDTSVTTDDCAFTFSFASSFSLSAFLAVTISWEYVDLGLPWRYVIESQICLCTPWNSQSLRLHATLWSTILLGHFIQICLRFPSSLVVKEGTFLLVPWVTL